MNCQRVSQVLSAYQDGELGSAAEQAVERHLQDCAACRSELDGLQALVGRMRLLPPPALDPFFATRVLAGLGDKRARPFRLLQAAAYALVFAMIFLTGFFLQTSGNGQSAAGSISSATFSSVLLEPQDLGLLSVHDDTLGLFNGGDHEQR
jgi:anti-sigma factor RsiW